MNLVGSNIDIGSLKFDNETVNDTQKKIVAVATNSTEYGISAAQVTVRLGLQMYIKLLQVQEALHIVLYVPLICGQYQVIGAKFLLVQQSMDILQVNTVMLAFISATVWLHIT